MMNPRTRGRLTLLAIAAIFALPIATAMYLYFSDNGWRPGGNTQNGDLITPPRMLPETPLTNAGDARRFRDVWSLVVLTDNHCDQTCQDALVKIRQARLWLGAKMPRLQTVLLPATADALPSAAAAAHPQLIIADPQLSEDIREIVGPYKNGQIFLVDPLGNMMMSYKTGTDMGEIRQDLGHLLQLSTIG